MRSIDAVPGSVTRRWQCRRLGELATVLAVLLPVAEGLGQEGEAKFSSWAKVESTTAEETKKYKESVKSGNFDAAARSFLEEIALPQLALEANRQTIERVRKRLREYLLADIDNEKVADDVSRAFMTFMTALAANEEAELVVRVNAMLLVGELQASKNKQPWAAATVPLAQAVVNADLPKAVRVAACVGLARHVEGGKGIAEEQQRVAAAALPTISAVLREPAAAGEGVENDWMVARCLSMLTALGPLAPATAAEVVRVLDDGGRSINSRVRAAATLAAVAGPDSKIDKAAVVKSLEALAIASLEGDVAAADRLLLDREYSGIPAGQTAPGYPAPGYPAAGSPDMGTMSGASFDPSQPKPPVQLIPKEACRRAAWRLAVLADAILADDSKRGLALLGGEVLPADKELAQKIRRAALELDAEPDEPTLRQALTDLKPPEPAAGADDEPADGDAAPGAAGAKPMAPVGGGQ